MKTKKTKLKESQYDNTVGNIYLVLRPDGQLTVDSSVKEVDPIIGASQHGIDQQNVYGAYKTVEEAQKAAEKAHSDYQTSIKKLEEKKGTVTTKLQKAIDKLEKERKNHMKMAKENPKDASMHKTNIEAIEVKIKNLMDKLSTVEKSKKPIEEKEQDLKKNLSENLDSVDFVTLDVPLFIRLLEYAKEDAQTDLDLHKIAENVVSLSKDGNLSMSDYNNIVSF